MYSAIAWQAAAQIGQGRRSISSPFMVAKNDSARALSQYCPVRPKDKVTWQSSAGPANAAEVVLAAAVGAEDHARFRVAGSDGVVQGTGDELGAQVIGDGIADDPAGGDVDDGGQVEPPFQVEI
jgi:hypothetical protein